MSPTCEVAVTERGDNGPVLHVTVHMRGLPERFPYAGREKLHFLVDIPPGLALVPRQEKSAMRMAAMFEPFLNAEKRPEDERRV